MAIQEYENKIAPEAINASPPEELHPVAAAFGGDIGQALQHGGETVASRLESLSSHLARMNFYRQEAQRADLLNQYKTSFQNKLYGDPNDPNATVTQIGNEVISDNLSFQKGQTPSNVNPTATPREIPAAIYNRQGFAASGAIQDADNWHKQASDEIIQKSQNLGLRNLSTLKSQMDSAWSSERMSIVKHEATQINDAQQKTFLHGMQLDADNAVTKQDPISLARTIDSINDQNKILNDSQHKEDDDPIRELTSNKFVSQALNNSMMANLKSNGGDPVQFQSILDKLHDDGKINDTVYENSGEHLDKISKGIITQNKQVSQTQVVNQRMNTMQLAVQNKLDLTNPNTVSEISAQDPELGTALSNYSLNKNKDIKDQDEAFAKATEDIFNAGSKEQISKYTMNVLKEGKISQDRLNILLGTAMDRGKHLADLDGQSKSTNPLQNMIDSGMKALIDWNKKQDKHYSQTYLDYMNGVKTSTPSESYSSAIGNAAIRNNPIISTIPQNGQVRIDKYGQRAMVYPNGKVESIKGGKSTDGKSDDRK